MTSALTVTQIVSLEERESIPHDFYRECFSNPHWLEMYGAPNCAADIDIQIDLIARRYPFVSKYYVIEGSTPVGFLHIHRINSSKNIFEVSGGILQKRWGVKIGTAALACTLEEIFLSLDGNWVVCKVVSTNLKSIRMTRRLGFGPISKALENEDLEGYAANESRLRLSLSKTDWLRSYIKS